MKKFFLLIIVSFIYLTSAHAIPAYPRPIPYVQPDGSIIMIRVVGDEYNNYTVAENGQQVVLNDRGFYVNASAAGSKNQGIFRSPLKRAGINDEVHFDYTKFRGLVILVNYTDRKFQYPVSVIDSMLNQEHYSGFWDNSNPSVFQPCTGSVRDYFETMSLGQFKPHFDVVGPVEIPRTSTYVQQTENAQYLFRQVLDSIDNQVDFKDYDTDGDGTVDMVFFLVAGPGANWGNGKVLWPHASVLSSQTLDGVKFGRYACSTELRGVENMRNYPDSFKNDPEYQLCLDGIGTIAHEFSHVLGLRDEYDADYASNGKCPYPGEWSVMAAGGYLNLGRTPCAYSALERYQAGFSVPVTISNDGQYSLRSINENGESYRINSAVNKEFFLLENRQQLDWDEYLPGHGMLVFRVDSTDAKVWSTNAINNNSAHPYYELLRAGGDVLNPNNTTNSSLLIETDHDPFPGSMGITSLNNNTIPNMRSWTGKATHQGLDNITELNGVVTFDVVSDGTSSVIEDFEIMPVTENDTTDVIGRFAQWDFLGGSRVEQSATLFKGLQAVSMPRHGEIISTVTPYKASSIEFEVINPTSSSNVIQVFESTDNTRTNWSKLKTFSGSAFASVPAKSTTLLQFNTDEETNHAYRIYFFSGSASERIYIDNLKLTYSGMVDHISVTHNNNKRVVSEHYFNLQGMEVSGHEQRHQIYIVHRVYSDGTVENEKIIK